MVSWIPCLVLMLHLSAASESEYFSQNEEISQRSTETCNSELFLNFFFLQFSITITFYSHLCNFYIGLIHTSALPLFLVLALSFRSSFHKLQMQGYYPYTCSKIRINPQSKPTHIFKNKPQTIVLLNFEQYLKLAILKSV